MSARDVSAATLGGAAAGVIVGLLARADMRLVAIVRNAPTELSLFGSFGVVMTFLVMALALATAYMWRQRGREPVAGGRGAARWSLAGLGLFTAVVLLTPLRQELAAPAELLLFVPVALLLGALPAWLASACLRALPEARTRLGRVVYRFVAAPAIIAALLLPVMLLAGVLQLLGIIPVPAN